MIKTNRKRYLKTKITYMFYIGQRIQEVGLQEIKNLWIDLQWASLVAQLVKNPPAMQETPVQFLGWEDLLKKIQAPTPVFLSFPGGSARKESACNVGDLCLIPGLGRFPGGGKDYPLQYSCLENPRGREAWQAIVHRFAKSWIRLSD